MTASLPAPFPALPPHLIPAMGQVRAQACSALLAGMADYAPRAAMLSHAQAAVALEALCAQLPAGAVPLSAPAVPAALPPGLPNLADDAAHDRYFHVYRVSASEGAAFLRSIFSAARLFHGEMAVAYAVVDAARFAAVGGGFASLIGRIAHVSIAPIEHTAAAPQTLPIEFAPMQRWLLGHQIFAALTQGLIFALQEFEAAMNDAQDERARAALRLAADLMMASAVAFRFTADFKAPDYHGVVRPSMMGRDVGDGFSGLLSLDHRRLVAILRRIRPLMGLAARGCADEHQRLQLALNHVYDDHKFVCAQFGGAEKPSLRCPHSSPLPGVEQLALYQQARVELLRPTSGVDTLIIGRSASRAQNSCGNVRFDIAERPNRNYHDAKLVLGFQFCPRDCRCFRCARLASYAKPFEADVSVALDRTEENLPGLAGSCAGASRVLEFQQGISDSVMLTASSQPLVSVVIPTFNRPHYLRAALASATAQTFQNIEIIVQDNASQQDLTPIVSELADSRITLFRNECNIGQTANISTVCARARGKYVAILADDDLWRPEYLATLVAPLEKYPELVVTFCAHDYIDEQGRINTTRTEAVNRRYRNRRRLAPGGHGPFVRIALVDRSICAISAAVYRRDAIDWQSIPNDLAYGCDNYINYLAARTGKTCYYIPSRLAQLRLLPQSASTDVKVSVHGKEMTARASLRCWDTFFKDSTVSAGRAYFAMKRVDNVMRIIMCVLWLKGWRTVRQEYRDFLHRGLIQPHALLYHLRYGRR